MRRSIEWAAGLFEGEGSFSLAYGPNSPRKYLLMQLLSTDVDVVEYFCEAVGVGKVNGPYKRANPNWKEQWKWAVAGKKAVAIATNPDFYNLLGQRRRERLNELLEFVNSQPPVTRKKTEGERGNRD